MNLAGFLWRGGLPIAAGPLVPSRIDHTRSIMTIMQHYGTHKVRYAIAWASSALSNVAFVQAIQLKLETSAIKALVS